MRRWTRHLAGSALACLLVACGSEPSASLEPVGEWLLSVNLSVSNGACTVTDATLTIESAGPPIAGQVAGGAVECTGDAAWAAVQVMRGTLDGRAVVLGLGLPGAGDYPLVLEGTARPYIMDGTVRAQPGSCRCTGEAEVTGTWSARRSATATR